MAFQCGFFNSINGDRKYNAEQMSNPYHRIVSNGVFAKNGQSTDLQVQATTGMTVKVKAGEGIFADKWAKLDSDMPFTILTAHVTNPRIDSIIVHIDSTPEVRAGSIIYKQGEAAADPQPPALVNTASIKEFRLANIRVNANAASITQANITDTRPTDECGFVSNLLEDSDVTALFAQWSAQFSEWNTGKHEEFDAWETTNKAAFDAWEAANKAAFDAWFADIKETLSTSTLIRSYTSQYVTPTQGETEIPINITQYNKNLDILQVFVNGLRLIPDEEYTIDSNDQITLAADVDRNTPVSFVVYKSVDGSEAESVVQQVYTLQQLQLTSNTGAVKRAMFSGDLLATFKSLGVGIHTMLASDSVTNTPTTGQYWRCIGHLTDQPYGWIIAISGEGKAYINFANGASTWIGWKELTNSQSPVSENGGVKISVAAGSNVLDAFRTAGTGFHTMYAAYNSTGVPVVGAYRLFGHMSAPTYGWLIAVKADASAWINYLDNGTWQGWKVLHDVMGDPLYYSAAGVFPTAGTAITPSKPLNECQHGWQLVFCGYDDVGKAPRDVYVQTYEIPKKNHKQANWNGERMSIPLIYQYVDESDSSLMCQKTLIVYNDRIIGGSTASTGVQRNMVLRAVYEY